MKRWQLFLPLAFFLILCVLLYKGLFLENKTELPSALLNNPVPAFRLTTLSNPEQIVTEEDLKGKVFLLNVWASWCPSCRAEHPYLLGAASARSANYWLELQRRPDRSPAVVAAL